MFSHAILILILKNCEKYFKKAKSNNYFIFDKYKENNYNQK